MNNITKFLIFIFLSSSCLYGQNADNESDMPSKNKRAINEFSYQFPLGIGYSHIRNINDKFLLGAGIHLGYIKYWPKYADMALVKIYSRNMFSKNKLNKRWDYDLGLYASLPYFEFEVPASFGKITSVYYNFWKLKVGSNLLVGTFFNEGELALVPAPLLTLVFVFSF